MFLFVKAEKKNNPHEKWCSLCVAFSLFILHSSFKSSQEQIFFVVLNFSWLLSIWYCLRFVFYILFFKIVALVVEFAFHSIRWACKPLFGCSRSLDRCIHLFFIPNLIQLCLAFWTSPFSALQLASKLFQNNVSVSLKVQLARGRNNHTISSHNWY